MGTINDNANICSHMAMTERQLKCPAECTNLTTTTKERLAKGVFWSRDAGYCAVDEFVEPTKPTATYQWNGSRRISAREQCQKFRLTAVDWQGDAVRFKLAIFGGRYRFSTNNWRMFPFVCSRGTTWMWISYGSRCWEIIFSRGPHDFLKIHYT